MPYHPLLLRTGQWNGTHVAVKVLETLAKADNSDLMEALLGQRISHPNVVRSRSHHALGRCDVTLCVELRPFANSSESAHTGVIFLRNAATTGHVW